MITWYKLIDDVAMTTNVCISSQHLSDARPGWNIVSNVNEARRYLVELWRIVIGVQDTNCH